jgi:hypothetical protein
VFRSKLFAFPCWFWISALLVSVAWSERVGFAGEGEIHALLAGRCLECHSGGVPQGGLDLSSSSGLAKGSDSGSVWELGQGLKSTLWRVVESGEMPPKAKLTEDEKKVLQSWIESDAPLPETPIDRFKITSAYRAGYDWWALRPLASARDPHWGEDPWVRNEIDGYVLDGLRARGLNPNGPATARSLLRRVHLDLTGLPPSYDEVVAFEQDPSDAAYRAIVERLLASPAYGERWARHWLDVVRFGESDGFERNYPRPNGWHYRDWVIRALNDDVAYDDFVRMQIAGDGIEPNESGYAAASFLVAGIHNTVVGSSDRMKRIARQDELEEKVGTLSQAFLGLTAQCARCHEHKYDPISMESYYQLAAAIQGVDHGERESRDPQIEQRERERMQARQVWSDQAMQLDQCALQLAAQRDAAPVERPIAPTATGATPMAAWNFELPNDQRWTDTVGGLRAQFHGNQVDDPRGLVLDGQSYLASDPIPIDVGAKTLTAWVTVDPLDQAGGGVVSLQTLNGATFDAIVYGEREPAQWMAGSDGFSRTQSFQGPAESVSGPVHLAIRYESDGTITAFRNGAPYGQSYSNRLQSFGANQAQWLFGLRHGPPGGNRFFRGLLHRVAMFDSALSDTEIEQLAGARALHWDLRHAWTLMSESDRELREQIRASLVQIDSELAALRAQAKKKIYTVVSNPNPGPTHILTRGDVYSEAERVRAGGITSLDGAHSDFGLAEDASDVQRRLALADWIVRTNRSLLARVMVNRVWHYHFGTGIVDTPNDFGFNGGRPTHPELLDTLASRFLDEGMRLKSLHRWIVLSSTYRMSTSPTPSGMQVDAQNRYLWRYPVRKLDGESVRDSMLQIAGVLRRAIGGPGFVDVDFREINGTTYYLPKPMESEDCFRRTVYRFNPRCERSPLLDVLDCPDPSATAPRRANTTTPLQALSLLNNPFVFQMSDALVGRVRGDSVGSSAEDDRVIQQLFQQVLLRLPNDDEFVTARELVRQHGATALARALWNTNEFLILE